MDTLALTDRDGTYGAVKFARACYAAGHPAGARGRPRPPPDPAVGRTAAVPTRTPVRGGELRDPVVGGLPRVTFLASADGAGGGRAGWAALCRLVSATHLAGERGLPVVDLAVLADQLGEQLAAGHLIVLLGPASELGRAASARWAPRRPRPGRPRAVARAGAAHPPPGRAGLPPAARAAPARDGVPAPPPTPPGWRGSPGRPGSARCSATRSATPTVATPPPSTSSTPPAGWSPSTGATSTAATPRGSSSPASRWPRSPRRSPGSPGWPPTPTARPGGCSPTPARWPTGARSTRARDLGLGEVHFPEFELLPRRQPR